ncbi:MAG: hypothetical protein KC506_00620 [Nanoarchaeota archaeon]|nr:hypothetical protein [Nanoarchaeota archaeon]
MERYNVLGSDVPGSEGVLIMPSRKYSSLVAARPDFTHVNFGDFYTSVQKEELVDAVTLSLTHEFGNSVVKLSSDEFRKINITPMDSNLYNISGKNGVRTFYPREINRVIHRRRDIGRARFFENLAVIAVSNLFSSRSEGSIQKQFRETIQEVQAEDFLRLYWNTILS